MSNISNASTPFKILFVDNSRTTRAVMSALFQQHGYTVDAVGTGPEAIEKLKADDFDLAVMDLYMPVMNGYEASKAIRQMNDAPFKDIPIIALTASQDPKDIELCKTNGMNDYVIKSEDNKALFDVIERYRKKKTG